MVNLYRYTTNAASGRSQAHYFNLEAVVSIDDLLMPPFPASDKDGNPRPPYHMTQVTLTNGRCIYLDDPIDVVVRAVEAQTQR